MRHGSQSKVSQKNASGNYRTSVLQFWLDIDHELFPRLKKEANRIISMFSTTYMCEQSFSAMKRIKSASRNRLLDITFKNLLIATTTNFLPDFAANECKQYQKSYWLIKSYWIMHAWLFDTIKAIDVFVQQLFVL